MSRLVICGICAVIAALRAKAAESEVSDGTQNPSLPPVILSQLSSSDKDLWLAFKNWKSGQPQTWTGDAMKVGAVGARQRWCFVETWHFQPSSFLWKEDDAPIAEVNISLTCPDADKTLRRFHNMVQEEILAAKEEVGGAKGLALADSILKLVRLDSIQRMAESDVEGAASEVLNGRETFSEALSQSAKATMDSMVQSGFHQVEVTSRAYFILPLVRGPNSTGLSAELVNFLQGGDLEWKNGGQKMEAAICKVFGSDVMVLQNLATNSTSLLTRLKLVDATKKKLKAASPTGTGTVVKVHLADEVTMYHPAQLRERKYVFWAIIGAIITLPLAAFLVAVRYSLCPCCGRCDLLRLLLLMTSAAVLQAFSIIAPFVAAHLGAVDCGTGMPWEVHSIFAALLAFHAVSAVCGNRDGINVYADVCLERFDFYSDIVFVMLAQSCHWRWATLSAWLLVVATLGQAMAASLTSGRIDYQGKYQRMEGYCIQTFVSTLLGIAPRSGFTGFGPALDIMDQLEGAELGHAFARVLLEDLPQVALQILFSREVRRDPFVMMSASVSVFFALKKLFHISRQDCWGKRSYSLMG